MPPTGATWERLPVEGTGSGLENAAESASGAAPEAAPPLTDVERTAASEKMAALQAELAALQGERPLILPSVDAQAVASVVADWTGIPLGRMVKDEVKAVLNLAETLNKRVIGQRHALEAIAARVQTSRARLDNPNKPIGVFMLAGPSGVGKMETGLALAEALYGGEPNNQHERVPRGAFGLHPQGLTQVLRGSLLKTFPSALLGRIVTIPYYPQSDEMLGTIIRLQLDRVVRRIADNHRALLTYDDAVVELFAKRCAEVEAARGSWMRN